MQIRNFLNSNPYYKQGSGPHHLEEMLTKIYLQKRKKISYIYNQLQTLSSINTKSSKRSWEHDFSTEITDEQWKLIMRNSKKNMSYLQITGNPVQDNTQIADNSIST